MRVPPGCPLSPRQFEVLDLVSQGRTVKQVARELGVAHSTARTHLTDAYRLLEVHNAANAVAVLGRHGWHGWQPPILPPPAPEPRLEPLQQAVHDHLHRWVTSRFSDQAARDAWHIAYRALRVAQGLPAERPETAPRPALRHALARELLQTLAADTLHPTQR